MSFDIVAVLPGTLVILCLSNASTLHMFAALNNALKHTSDEISLRLFSW